MNSTLSVTNYKVSTRKLQGASVRKRIAAISDLHSCSFGRRNEILLEKIKEYKPDILMIAGDMVTGARPDKAWVALDFLAKISENMPVIYAYGNHERRYEDFTTGARPAPEMYLKNSLQSGFKYDKFLNRINKYTTLLQNAYTELPGDKRVRIYGLDMPLEKYKRGRKLSVSEVREMLGTCDKSYYNILLAHDPYFFPVYERWGADLVISGHVHGGIVRLPILGGAVSPRYEFFPKYSAGRYEINSSIMLLSRGLGSHSVIQFRIFNDPEIMIIDLI